MAEYIYWEPSTGGHFLQMQYDRFSDKRKSGCVQITKEDWDALREQRRELGDQNHRIVNDSATNQPVIEEFDPEAEAWTRELSRFESMTADQLKAYLYQTARYRFVDDTLASGFDTSTPMISVDGQNLSVDEYTQYFQQYEGDNGHEIDSDEYKATKTEAKEYIRSLVDAFKA